jgi:methionine-S-sulfoxide reductase
MEQAIFAAGLFLPLQHYFDQIPGVVETSVGYTGGTIEDPTYEDVLAGTGGHVEAILAEFDTQRVSYATLVRHFFRMHDPTQARLGKDEGDTMYRSIIFYLTEEQKETAERLMHELESKYPRAMMTEILPAGAFYRAEAYHQKYAERTGHGVSRIPYEPLP